MVKIRNKKRIIWAFKQFKNAKRTQKWLSHYLGITPRWFRIIYKRWISNSEELSWPRQLGRPRVQIEESIKQIVLQEYETAKNAVYLEKVIYAKHKIRVPHNRIHMVLRELGLAKKEPNKSRRRKPWVRYERTHSLSAGHMDWHQKTANSLQFCAVIDDSSRKILAAGEFSAATCENSIKLVQEVLDKYHQIRTIREMITDHGTQFYGNKKNKDGKSKHGFTDFLTLHKIKHILCRIKHPQSNGKIEKFFHLYDRHRHEFGTLEEFINWYNNRPHGSLNLRRAETPNMAFEARLPHEYFFNLTSKFLKWEDFEVIK